MVLLPSHSSKLIQLNKKPHPFHLDGAFLIKSRRRPTLPHSYPCSTIGPEGLNFRVRDGNGCDPLGIATEKPVGLDVGPCLTLSRQSHISVAGVLFVRLIDGSGGRVASPLTGLIFYGQASRPISTGQLNTLLCLHTRPINVVVSNGPSGDCSRGYLILKEASRLDAFSGYPFRT